MNDQNVCATSPPEAANEGPAEISQVIMLALKKRMQYKAMNFPCKDVGCCGIGACCTYETRLSISHDVTGTREIQNEIRTKNDLASAHRGGRRQGSLGLSCRRRPSRHWRTTRIFQPSQSLQLRHPDLR